MNKCKNCKYWIRKTDTHGECQNIYTQEEIHMVTNNYFSDTVYYTHETSRCVNFDPTICTDK